MNCKKYKRTISSILILVLLCASVLPILAEEPPAPLAITVNANYYPSQTEGEYKIIFTTMTDIPAFTELGFKITLTQADVDRASFEEKILFDGDTKSVLYEEKDFTYKLNRASAQGISQKTAFANLEVENAEVPTETNLLFSEFYIINADDQTVSITPSMVFEQGPIVPELTQKEQTIYDAIIALPNPNEISYYAQDGSIASLADNIFNLTTLKTNFEGLSEQEKNNINEVLVYNGYSSEQLTKLNDLYAAMNQGIGLIEIANTLKAVTGSELVKYQFMLSVFESMKTEVLATQFPDGSVASTELTAASSALDTLKTNLDAALASASFDDKTYACGDQITRVQTLSSHKYYSKYITALLTQIDAVINDVTTNFVGREESKKNLLSYLSGYKSTVQGIQNGVSDIPTMKVSEITRGKDYTVTLNRKSTLSSSFKAEVLVVVTDEDGTEIDRTQELFPSGNREFELSIRASKSVYDYNMTVTVTVYYILDGASFYIGEQDCFCYTTSSTGPGGNGLGSIGSLGGYNGGIPAGTTGNTNNKDTSSDDDGVTGGTIFPSDETIEPEKKPNNTNVVLFHDIARYDWAKDAIEGLYYAGIVNGMEDGVYNPSGLVTREQFAKMVVQLFGLSTGNGNTNFVDVKADAWYAPYITSAMQAGYIQGQSNEYFGIGESIMRQDMATILYRALGDMNSKASLSFTDKENIASYAEDAIAELVGLGVLNGYEDGTFNPRGTATRAEAAKTIWGIYQILND